ncbi:MAG: fumarylacetoacetate hydrolase family protein [Paludibacteraceae bacterium]|nr:fumarylacetoacetate hydrolase family protein [Paludibacteraceae bacterium]
MKIIGFIYRNGKAEMVLKGDSCLLNGRKPFFVPDWTSEVGVTDCIILRVCRLGKEIAPKFADRYYDAIAPGADFIAMDRVQELQAAGRPWTSALAFDYSLAIGEWISNDEMIATALLNDELIISPEEAIAQASKVMTIRQGDLIYIQVQQAPQPVQKEQILRKEIDGQEKLYCKIK